MSSEATLAAYKAQRIAEMKAQTEAPPAEKAPVEKGTSWFSEAEDDVVDKEIEQAEEELQYEEPEADDEDASSETDEEQEEDDDADEQEDADDNDQTESAQDEDEEYEDGEDADEARVEKKSGKGFEKSLERKMRRIARLEQELAAYRSGQAQPQSQRQAPVQDIKPDPANYQGNWAKFTEDLAAWSGRQAVAQYEYNKTLEQRNKAWNEQVAEVKKSAPDYDDVMEDFKHQFSWVNIPGLNEAIAESPVAVKLWYHLGTNTKEADRIFRLPAHRALVEIGKIESNLVAKKAPAVEVKKVSKAPKPTSSEKGKAAAPKDLKSLAKADGNDREAQKAYREQRMSRRPRY